MLYIVAMGQKYEVWQGRIPSPGQDLPCLIRLFEDLHVARILETVVRNLLILLRLRGLGYIRKVKSSKFNASSAHQQFLASLQNTIFRSNTRQLLFYFLNQVFPFRRKQTSINNIQRPPIWSSTWVLFLLLPWLPPWLLFLLVREGKSPLAVGIQRPWKLNPAVLTILPSRGMGCWWLSCQLHFRWQGRCDEPLALAIWRCHMRRL